MLFARTVKGLMFINIIIICGKYYYSNMVALTGIHENVMLSNLINIGTMRAIESVLIFTRLLSEVEFRESLKAFFPQGQSKLSAIISFQTISWCL